MLLWEKGVVNGIMLRFFVTRANCFCLLHFSHGWLSAFVWPPAGYEWNVWRDEPVFTGCLLLLFVVTSVLLFLVSGFYAYTTNTGEIKKECTILILFLHFHVLPGAFGEKPYTLVLIMWLWISCVHRLFYMRFFFFSYHFKECEYVLLIYWLVRVYFILFLRSEPMMCYRVMPRRKQTTMVKETWWNRCMFGGKQENRGSCHIVLDLLISPYSANLLRLHLYRDRGWKTVFGFLLTGTRLPLEFRPALHKTCHGVRLVAQWTRWNNKQGWTQGARNLGSTPAENCKNGR